MSCPRGGEGGGCERAVNDSHPRWGAGTDPPPWPHICPSGWLTWFLRAPASQPACRVMIAGTSHLLRTGQKGVSWKFHRTPSKWDSWPLFPAGLYSGSGEQMRADL